MKNAHVAGILLLAGFVIGLAIPAHAKQFVMVSSDYICSGTTESVKFKQVTVKSELLSENGKLNRMITVNNEVVKTDEVGVDDSDHINSILYFPKSNGDMFVLIEQIKEKRDYLVSVKKDNKNTDVYECITTGFESDALKK